MYIGKLVQLSDLSFEYRKLAEEDENAATLLYQQACYRHAVYFSLQAMEKYTRARIFGLVSPGSQYFRDVARTHNLDDLLVFLVDVASGKETIRAQIKDQLERHVLGGVRFGKLHNDLRYPLYQERTQSYAALQIRKEDADLIFAKLQSLKAFLRDLDMLRR